MHSFKSKKIGLVSNKLNLNFVFDVYKRLEELYTETKFYILQAENIFCPQKQANLDYLIIFTETCEHLNENCILINDFKNKNIKYQYEKINLDNEKINEEKINSDTEKIDNFNNEKINEEKINFDTEKIDNFNNEKIYLDNGKIDKFDTEKINDFNSKNSNNNHKKINVLNNKTKNNDDESFNNEITKHELNNLNIKTAIDLINDFLCNNITFTKNSISYENSTKFIISRLSRVERIKEKSIFCIFFTTPYYQLALKVKNFLNGKDKISYLVHLNDVCYERLTCIDNMEVCVILDCVDHYDIELLVPLVVPFDLILAFESDYKWNGEYEKNFFDIKSDKIVLSENRIEVFDKVFENIEMVNVEYKNEEIDYEIHEGRKGIASEYENEGK